MSCASNKLVPLLRLQQAYTPIVCLVGERVERSGADSRFGMTATPRKFGSCVWVGHEFIPTFVWMK
jgi:hypothetical protein